MFVFFVVVVVVSFIVMDGPDDVGDNLVPAAEIQLVSFPPTTVRRVDQLTPLPRPADLEVPHRWGHFSCEGGS